MCYLTIQLVKLGGFFPYWLGFQGVSLIGWYGKYTCQQWKGSLPLGGLSLILFVDYSVRKKSNLFNSLKKVC